MRVYCGTSFHSVLIGLASFIGVQQGVIASPSSPSYRLSAESAEALEATIFNGFS